MIRTNPSRPLLADSMSNLSSSRTDRRTALQDQQSLYTSARDARALDRLPPAYEVVPVAPGTPANAVVVDPGVAIGGIAVSGTYFDAQWCDNSSFFLSISLGGGCNAWCFPSCFNWCGGWAPFCSPWNSFSWCGRSRWCRPWFWPSCWYDPWCPSFCWPATCAPGWSLCFGWGAWSTSFLWGPNFLPAPPVAYTSYPASTIVYEQAAPAPLPTAEQAWSQLAAGYDQDALSSFAQLAQANPQDAEAFVGYALANSMLGSDGSAIVAMRRALAIRPEAILAAPIDPSSRVRLEVLVEHYKEMSRSGLRQQSLDGFFMVGALQTILGEDSNAYFAVDTAIQRGDSDPSALNLRELLRQRLSQGF